MEEESTFRRAARAATGRLTRERGDRAWQRPEYAVCARVSLTMLALERSGFSVVAHQVGEAACKSANHLMRAGEGL